MKPRILHEYLESRVQEIVLEPPDLWPRIQNQLQKKRLELPRLKTLSLRQSSLLIAALVVIGLSIFLFGTAPGRVLAQNIVRFFIPVGQTSYQLPGTEQTHFVYAEATFRAVSTEKAERIKTLEAERSLTPLPTTTPTPVDQKQNDGITCGSTEMAKTFICQLLVAQRWFGYPVMVLPSLPYPDTMLFMKLEPASATKIVYIYYTDPGIVDLQLIQGQGDFPELDYHGLGVPFWGAVPEGAVQQVSVGTYPGEFVIGDYALDPTLSTVTWDPTINVMRLRWKENQKWYELYAYWYDSAKFGKGDMMALSSKIVPFSSDDQVLAGAAGSIEMVEKEAGFTILQPGYLPDGFRFSYAQFDPIAKRAMLFYSLIDPVIDVQKYLAIYEMPAEEAIRQFPPDYDNPIEIGNLQRDNRKVLTWETKGLSIEMLYYVYPSLNIPPGEIDDLQKIAQSM